MGCSPPGFSVHGISQERILEWVAISSSRGSLRPRDWTLVSCIAGDCFTIWATREAAPCPWLLTYWTIRAGIAPGTSNSAGKTLPSWNFPSVLKIAFRAISFKGKSVMSLFWSESLIYATVCALQLKWGKARFNLRGPLPNAVMSQSKVQFECKLYRILEIESSVLMTSETFLWYTDPSGNGFLATYLSSFFLILLNSLYKQSCQNSWNIY